MRFNDTSLSEVNFAELAHFSWSRLYVFGSYTSQATAERALGFTWNYRWPPIEAQDGHVFLVFVDSGRVVSALHYEYPKITGIEHLFRPQGYSRDSARFQLVPDSATALPYRALVWRP